MAHLDPHRVFPSSNVRGCIATPPTTPPPGTKPYRKPVKLSAVKEPYDRLAQRPKKRLRYVGASGKLLFDDYYVFPKPEKAERAVTRNKKDAPASKGVPAPVPTRKQSKPKPKPEPSCSTVERLTPPEVLRAWPISLLLEPPLLAPASFTLIRD